MLRMVNQSKLVRSYKTCKKKYMYGFKIPLGYEDVIRLDKLHGIDKWQGATKLEMGQLHEYDTFHTNVLGQLLGRSSRRSEFILCMRASTGFYLFRFVRE
jgi:hypothetical protein